MKHPSLVQWERKLQHALDELDDYLENQYGDLFKLHPARPARGKTIRKSRDGLFDITANFSLGIGSERGRGYIVKVRLSTLDQISEDIRTQIEETALAKLKEFIPKYFPTKKLWVEKDKHVIKVYGDLSLGRV